MAELVSAAMFLDREHPSARVIVITGEGKKAFAAGADIKEMAQQSYAEVRQLCAGAWRPAAREFWAAQSASCGGALHAHWVRPQGGSPIRELPGWNLPSALQPAARLGLPSSC